MRSLLACSRLSCTKKIMRNSRQPTPSLPITMGLISNVTIYQGTKSSLRYYLVPADFFFALKDELAYRKPLFILYANALKSSEFHDDSNFHQRQYGRGLMMRHDWTLLCSRVETRPGRGIDLINVVTAVKVADRYRTVPIDTTIPVDLPICLVSQWTAEFETDKKVHSGVLQLMAPGGERVLREYKLEFDCRDTIVLRSIYKIPDLRFVGVGTYEFHIVLEGFADLGEWGRACLRMS